MTNPNDRITDLLIENHALRTALDRSDEHINRQAKRMQWLMAALLTVGCALVIVILWRTR